MRHGEPRVIQEESRVRGSQSWGDGEPLFLALSLEIISILGNFSKIKIVQRTYL